MGSKTPEANHQHHDGITLLCQLRYSRSNELTLASLTSKDPNPASVGNPSNASGFAEDDLGGSDDDDEDDDQFNAEGLKKNGEDGETKGSFTRDQCPFVFITGCS